MRLAHDAQAQTQARRYARSWSAEHAVAAPLVDDIELVVAELVSNAIRHGTAPYEVELYDNNGVIRGEVCDGSPVAPKANPSPDERGGYDWASSTHAHRAGAPTWCPPANTSGLKSSHKPIESDTRRHLVISPRRPRRSSAF